jgi:anti-sigma factor RsiW
MSTICLQLDDYLEGELDEAQRAAFELHLTDCEDCRGQVAFASQLNGWLAGAQDGSAPPQLVARIEHRLRWATRKAYAWRMAVGALAASLLVGLGLWRLGGNRQPLANRAPVVKSARPQPLPAAPPATMPVRISFHPDANMIVRPLKSTNPRVSIVWVYPTVRVAQSDQQHPSDP